MKEYEKVKMELFLFVNDDVLVTSLGNNEPITDDPFADGYTDGYAKP